LKQNHAFSRIIRMTKFLAWLTPVVTVGLLLDPGMMRAKEPFSAQRTKVGSLFATALQSILAVETKEMRIGVSVACQRIANDRGSDDTEGNAIAAKPESEMASGHLANASNIGEAILRFSKRAGPAIIHTQRDPGKQAVKSPGQPRSL
jgi:hypothetical protein